MLKIWCLKFSERIQALEMQKFVNGPAVSVLRCFGREKGTFETNVGSNRLEKQRRKEMFRLSKTMIN